MSDDSWKHRSIAVSAKDPLEELREIVMNHGGRILILQGDLRIAESRCFRLEERVNELEKGEQS